MPTPRFLLPDYTVKFNDLNGNSVTFTLPAPAPNPLDQAVNNTGVGLQQGDLVLFTSNAGSAYAVAEVTAPLWQPEPVLRTPWRSAMRIRCCSIRTRATSNDLKQMATAAGIAGPAVGVTATRIWAITYYLDNTTTPGTPTLMRLVNARRTGSGGGKRGRPAIHLRHLRQQLETLLNATGDGGMGLATPISPNQIRTINLAHLTIRSQLPRSRAVISRWTCRPRSARAT